MFNKDYDNQDTTQEFVHVYGFQMTVGEFNKFIPKLVKRISIYGREVSMFFMPAKALEGYNTGGISCNVQCHPRILKEVSAAVLFDF